MIIMITMIKQRWRYEVRSADGDSPQGQSGGRHAGRWARTVARRAVRRVPSPPPEDPEAQGAAEVRAHELGKRGSLPSAEVTLVFVPLGALYDYRGQ